MRLSKKFYSTAYTLFYFIIGHIVLLLWILWTFPYFSLFYFCNNLILCKYYPSWTFDVFQDKFQSELMEQKTFVALFVVPMSTNSTKVLAFIIISITIRLLMFSLAMKHSCKLFKKNKYNYSNSFWRSQEREWASVRSEFVSSDQ